MLKLPRLSIWSLQGEKRLREHQRADRCVANATGKYSEIVRDDTPRAAWPPFSGKVSLQSHVGRLGKAPPRELHLCASKLVCGGMTDNRSGHM